MSEDIRQAADQLRPRAEGATWPRRVPVKKYGARYMRSALKHQDWYDRAAWRLVRRWSRCKRWHAVVSTRATLSWRPDLDMDDVFIYGRIVESVEN